jgi:hypothetical protein
MTSCAIADGRHANDFGPEKEINHRYTWLCEIAKNKWIRINYPHFMPFKNTAHVRIRLGRDESCP